MLFSRIFRPLLCLGLLLVIAPFFPETFAQDVVPPSETVVFESGADGYHTFRIPALVQAASGDLLAFCEGRKTSRSDHGDIDLVLRRSTDGGRTWGPLQLVYEEGGTEKITIGNPCPVVDHETGRIWLPFTRDNRRLLMTHSDDHGRTWAEPRDLSESLVKPGWNWIAAGPGNAIQLTRGKYAGRLVVPCDHRVSEKGRGWKEAGRSHVIYSDDHGQTWRLGQATDFAMNECAVVELNDGRLLLNMRSYRGKGCRAVAVSDDGGHTWGEARDAEALPEPVCQASTIRYTWPDDDERSRILFSNPASSSGRHHLTVRLSYDEGETWPVSKLVYQGPAAYSQLVALDDGQIGLVYEQDNYRQIVFSRFSLEWLSDGRDFLNKPAPE